MNVHEYISSGIVETYVLDLCDEKECAEFQRICMAHPEVKSAKESFEKQLEEQSLCDAILPPKHLKSRILAHIEIESEKKQGLRVQEGEFSHVHLKINWLKYLAAAAVILLFISTALNFYFFGRYRHYAGKTVNRDQPEQMISLLEGRINDYKSAIAVLNTPGLLTVDLKPAAGSPAPESSGKIFRTHKASDLFLFLRELPQASRGQLYQLWGFVAGKPVNAGSFNVLSKDDLVRLKNIHEADHFWVTLEENGSSKQPTTDQLFITSDIDR